MPLTVALAADHGGYDLKAALLPWLRSRAPDIVDLGSHTLVPTDDYPDYAEELAQAVAAGRAQRGILICGSGVGACIAANKVPGVRACLCHDTYSAHQGVEHDDMNVICLGARVIGIELAKELIDAFLKARFIEEEKYRRRLNKVISIEAKSMRRKRVLR